MKIAVVDDEEKYLDKIEKSIGDFFAKKGELAEISRYTSGKLLLTALGKGECYDVFFLDVEMADLNGLELAKRICEFQKNVKIVLVTSFPKYIMDGYKIHAYYFVLKKDYQTEIPEVLEMIWSDAEEKESFEDCYFIQNNNFAQSIRFDKIVWITKEKKYIIFHCIGDGKDKSEFQEFKERKTLEQVYSQLPAKYFIYINKGCIINMYYVYSQKSLDIVLKADDKKYVGEISQRLSPRVKQALAEYWKK